MFQRLYNGILFSIKFLPNIRSDEISNMVGISTFHFTYNLEEQRFYFRVICCFGQYIKGFEVGLHFDSPLLRDLVETFVSLNKIGRDALQIVEYESSNDAGTRL
jgi:hypothetical protein